ncbi:MAG: EamA family transporter [Acidobacteriota bacterium]
MRKISSASVPPGRAWLAWGAVCLLWGTTYLFIRIAVETIPPLLMAGTRWLVAGLALAAASRLSGGRVPPRAAWPSLAARGVLLLGFGNGAVAWAEQTIPSGMAALLVAIAPFWMVGIDAVLGDGAVPAPRQVAGLVVGFAGIVVLVWPELTTRVPHHAFLVGLVATQLACAGWAVGSAYARRHARRDEETFGAVGLEMLFGGLLLVVAGTATGEWARLRVTPRTGGALAYLIVVGSVAGYSAYRYALRYLPVAVLSLYAYVNTVIAIALGVVILGETFSWRMGVAAAAAVAGVALVRQPRVLAP